MWVNPARHRPRLAGLQWGLFLIVAFAASLYLGWQALVAVDFLYPVWYEAIGIDQNIETYGPQNRYREGFEDTTKAERVRLFGAIVEAVQNGGRGLGALVYHGRDGAPYNTLLTAPEIVHLRDVARLVERLRPLGQTAVALALLLGVALRFGRVAAPRMRTLTIGVAALLTPATALLLLLGPERVFYWLHTQVFPPGHAWFFYYQDSLMSTMMKAPDLFGYIALMWIVLALLLVAAMVALAAGTRRSWRKPTADPRKHAAGGRLS